MQCGVVHQKALFFFYPQPTIALAYHISIILISTLFITTGTAALVPYADMLNHYRPRETKWQFDNMLQGFTIVSMGQIGCGLQVYDSYGQKCNHRFLLNYGFSVENNVEPDGFCPNEVPLLMQLHKDDPLYEFKCSYFHRESYLPQRRLRICIAENENFHLMLSLLRVVQADKDDMNIITAITGERGNRSIRDAQSAISVDNEIRAMELLLSMTKEYLAAYPQTYVVDKDICFHV
jgi:histone-lysine N-methyltransferase SETD3